MDESYVTFARRWWWLVVAGSLVAFIVTAYSLNRQPALYSSTATVEVGRVIQDSTPSQADLNVINQLVPAYTQIAKRPALLNKTIEDLKLPLTTDQLQSMTLIQQVPQAPLIGVTVIDTDPRRAAAIANEIADQIVHQSPPPSTDAQATQAFVQSQLTDLKKKISDGQSSIQSLQDQIAHLTSASDISDAQRQLDVLNQQVNTWQASYAQLLQSVQPTATNIVSVINPASVPSKPMSRSQLMYYGLGIAAGAGLSVIIALLLELLWPSIRSPKDLEPITEKLPIISVPRFRTKSQEVHIVVSEPASPAAAAYRQLRNVLGLSDDLFVRRLAVTSARTGEGKTTTASNLAIAIAASYQRVLLVDANMRNPELAERFQLEPAPGFSDLLRGSSTVANVIQQTQYWNLNVITAGRSGDDFPDLLFNQFLGMVMDDLSKTFDTIVFDCPAALEENEPLNLLKHADEVIAVVEIGGTKSTAYKELVDTLKEQQVSISAIVGNKASTSLLNRIWFPWSYQNRRLRQAQRRRQQHSGNRELSPVMMASNDGSQFETIHKTRVLVRRTRLLLRR